MAKKGKKKQQRARSRRAKRSRRIQYLKEEERTVVPEFRHQIALSYRTGIRSMSKTRIRRNTCSVLGAFMDYLRQVDQAGAEVSASAYGQVIDVLTDQYQVNKCARIKRVADTFRQRRVGKKIEVYSHEPAISAEYERPVKQAKRGKSRHR